MYDQVQVKSAVNVLQEAPDNILLELRCEVLTVIASLRKKLTIPSDECCGILDKLLAKVGTIEKLKKQGVVESIGPIRPSPQDIRFWHVSTVQRSVKDSTSLLHALFAYRSLAFEFEQYLKNNGLQSRVEELANNLKLSENRTNGHMNNFLRQNGMEDRTYRNAISLGIKILVLETIFGSSGISLLVAFVFGKFSNLNYKLLENIISFLRDENSAYSALGVLAKSLSEFVDDGQKHYDGMF
ncbi:hypothetical protein CPSG_05320 [Coccidioides posadasii str. Silveira]|uniref:Uncharacterized protein n=1 Tax=Coccidioides posadasii (strain RMSCC 757 / Silveira) TaxID=443226 RepID=E9D552_COCPS|nr:hypothetical protein CPSG_05320 [Coccidioides posadasii str. Silveira]